MESVATFFKEENDILYILGEQRERKKGKIAFVKNLLTQTNHTMDEIAQLAEVTVAFVEEVRASLR